MHSSHLSSGSTCNCSEELSVLSHPGFDISFEDLDIQLQRKNMSMESQNRDYHWVRAHLKSKGPQANLEEVSNLKFLPTLDDQQRQRSNYIILTSLILVTYFDVLAPLKDACILHIPHKYTNEMAQKSKKVFFLNV